MTGPSLICGGIYQIHSTFRSGIWQYIILQGFWPWRSISAMRTLMSLIISLNTTLLYYFLQRKNIFLGLAKIRSILSFFMKFTCFCIQADILPTQSYCLIINKNNFDKKHERICAAANETNIEIWMDGVTRSYVFKKTGIAHVCFALRLELIYLFWGFEIHIDQIALKKLFIPGLVITI